MKFHSLASATVAFLALATLLACSPPTPSSAEKPDAIDLEVEAHAAFPDQPTEDSTPPRRPRRPVQQASAPFGAQLRYIDESGQVRLAARIEDIPESQRSTAMQLETPKAPRRFAGPTDEIRNVNNVDVTIYTTPTCGYCRAAVAHFKKRGIDYTNHDVTADQDAHDEYLEITGGRRGVPVIVVGDSWIQGWSLPEFERLLASAR